MKKILLILYLCAFNISFSQFEKINTFQNKLIENEITGSNVALVWHNGKVIYHNIENSYHTNGKAINENSIFPIWSMSKPITIVAMMILKERGMIDFKDNVSKYLPEFKNLTCKNPDGSIYQCKNSLSIFHLLTHRSGYQNHLPKVHAQNPMGFRQPPKVCRAVHKTRCTNRALLGADSFRLMGP